MEKGSDKSMRCMLHLMLIKMQIVCIKYNFYNLINCAARQTLDGAVPGEREREERALPTLPHAALLADVGGPLSWRQVP